MWKFDIFIWFLSRLAEDWSSETSGEVTAGWACRYRQQTRRTRTASRFTRTSVSTILYQIFLNVEKVDMIKFHQYYKRIVGYNLKHYLKIEFSFSNGRAQLILVKFFFLIYNVAHSVHGTHS